MTTITRPDLKEQVLSILQRHEGKQAAIKGMEIARMCNLRDDRAVQQAIEELIKDGHPVAASCRKPMGYFIPMSFEEAHDYDRQMRSRIIGDNARRVRFNRNFARHYEGSSRLRLL